MTKHLVASFVALGLLAGPAAAATSTKAPTEKSQKAKVHKEHAKKSNMKDDTSKTKTK